MAECDVNGLSVPLSANTRAVFVVSATSTGISLLNTISADFSVSMSTS